MNGTMFQHRLGAILKGTDSLTEEEIKMVDGLPSIELVEKIDEAFEESIEEEDVFRFHV